MDSYKRRVFHRGGNAVGDDVDHLLSDLGMTSASVLRSRDYEELIRRQLSFSEDLTDNGNEMSGTNVDDIIDQISDDGFDAPLSAERQQGMKAVQNTLERLDSKHGVLQRPASAETVRTHGEESELLKRTFSDCVVAPSQKLSEPKETNNNTSTTSPSKEPAVKAPLTTTRKMPASSQKNERSSKVPLKAAPPTTQTSDGNLSPSDNESVGKTSSFRQLLVESKAETSDLKRQIEELSGENKRLREQTNGESPGQASQTSSVSHIHGKYVESEKRCDQLIREKENMATELWKLRQRVEEIAAAPTKSDFESNARTQDVDDSLQSYNPESPSALRKQILNLESQVADLNEANETASAEVLRLDQENQMLTRHINDLKISAQPELEDELERLRHQVDQLRMSDARRSHDSDSEQEIMQLRSEVAQVKIDLKAAQEKSNVLMEENYKLRDQIREAKKGNKWKGSGSSVNDENRTHDKYSSDKEAAWEEIYNLKQKIREYTTYKQPLSSRSLDNKHSRSSSYNDKLATASHDYSPLNSTFSSKLTARGYTKNTLDRAPSPTGQSDVSESTTILMAGFDSYKPRTRILSGFDTSYPPPLRATHPHPIKKVEDDRMSECTMDILNEASYSTKTYGGGVTQYEGGAYDDDSEEEYEISSKSESRQLNGYNSSNAQHVRRSSVGSSSVHSESTQETERLQVPANFGHRSIVAPVLPTQHNRGQHSNYAPLSTKGRRPFAPRTPADLSLGDIAKFTRSDGRICRGVVKFVGHLHDKNDTFIGLELENTDGSHDGLYNGIKYFDCKPGRGAFITFNKIIMVWGS